MPEPADQDGTVHRQGLNVRELGLMKAAGTEEVAEQYALGVDSGCDAKTEARVSKRDCEPEAFLDSLLCHRSILPCRTSRSAGCAQPTSGHPDATRVLVRSALGTVPTS